MSKEIYYKHCHLERKTENGKMVTTSYIPEQFAVVNKALKLKNSSGDWENGWVVKVAGNRTCNPPDSYIQIKAHKKNTGDSLPK